jgi:hypothetical protein
MSKKAKQWYSLTEEQLGWLVAQGPYSGAKQVLEQVRKIKEAGGTPVIYYSEFNGFRIIDEDDPDQFMIGLAIGSKAMPFRS